MSKQKQLTWNELADIYDRYNTQKARTLPLDNVFRWAKNREDLFTLTDDGGLVLNTEEKN